MRYIKRSRLVTHTRSLPLAVLLKLARGALRLFDEALEARDLLVVSLAGLRVKFRRDLEAGVRALLGFGFCVGGGRGRGLCLGPLVFGRAGREFRRGFGQEVCDRRRARGGRG